MGILDQLLKEIPTDNALDQLRELCDKIFGEEKVNFEVPKLIVRGSNVFLCLEVPGRTQKEVAFLALERESPTMYLAVLWTYQKSELKKLNDKDLPSPRRSRVWKIEDERPKKILTEYAKVIKYLKGE